MIIFFSYYTSKNKDIIHYGNCVSAVIKKIEKMLLLILSVKVIKFFLE